jgi:hypothetical protein
MAHAIRTRRSALSRRAWLALACGLLFFLGGQVFFRWLAQRRPDCCELEYGQNLKRLRARLAEKPGHLLVLVLGNSRAGRGFRPADLPPLPGDPVVFDFAQSGSGPIHNRLWLYRLREQGIRPDWLIVETWPPFWQLYERGEEVLNVANLGILTWKDVQQLRPYAEAPRRLCLHWLETQLAPMVPNRGPLLRTFFPKWLPAATYTIAGLELMDGDGWRPEAQAVAQEYFRRKTTEYRETFSFVNDFHIPAAAAHALTDTLAVCRAEGVRPLLLLMPESSDCHTWFSPAARAEIEGFLQHLSQEYDAPLVDARAWLPDEDFADPAHLIVAGATAFTQRFGREVLAPLLKGEPLPPSPGEANAVARHE